MDVLALSTHDVVASGADMAHSTLACCPTCNEPLGGLAAYCWRCLEYVADMGAATTDRSPGAEATRHASDARTEKEFQRDLRGLIVALGYTVYDMSQDRPTRQPSGIPDLYVQGHGRRVWVEVKRPSGGRVSAAQTAFIEAERAHGGEAFVARSEDDFMRWHEGER